MLVDTGSSGSAVAALGPHHQRDHAGAGSRCRSQSNTIAECLPFAGGYAWGAVASADIRIGGESANNVPVQVIDDDGADPPTAPKTCQSYGANETVSALDANGLIGVSVLMQDCGPDCQEHRQQRPLLQLQYDHRTPVDPPRY